MAADLEPARPRLVVSLGNNAFGPSANGARRAQVLAAARSLAPLADDWDLVVTHGNSPQVTALSASSLAAGHRLAHLDVLEAEAGGVLGYQLESALDAALPQGDVATLITAMEVAAEDPAFGRPDHAVGPVMDEVEARALAVERGWFVGPSGGGWRRLVPSPEPLRLLERRALEVLVAAGVTVVCAGGGGIPVVVDDEGVHGVHGVIDKDLAAGVVADAVHAEGLVLLTDADGLYEGFGTAAARRIRTIGADTAGQGVWARETMAPKVEACRRFVRERERWAAIGSLRDAVAVVAGEAGTRVEPGDRPTTYWA